VGLRLANHVSVRRSARQSTATDMRPAVTAGKDRHKLNRSYARSHGVLTATERVLVGRPPGTNFARTGRHPTQ